VASLAKELRGKLLVLRVNLCLWLTPRGLQIKIKRIITSIGIRIDIKTIPIFCLLPVP
jgi:hypothetical protein